MKHSELARWLPRVGLWLGFGVFILAACAAKSGQERPVAPLVEAVRPLGDRLASEASRIPSLFGPNAILMVALLVFAAIVAARAVNGAVHSLWRLGLDSERHLARWVVFVKVGLAIFLAYTLLRRFVEAAPILSGAVIVVFAAVGLATIRGTLENLAVGVDLAFRRRFRPGDRIAVGEYSGTVRETGLMSVRLRTPNGTTIHIPNRLLNEHAILVTRAENTARVVVELRGTGELGAELLERIRWIALLSPYRSIGTTVRAEVRDERTLEVEIQAQSSVLAGDAETQLRASIRSLLDEERQAALSRGA